MTDTSKNLTVNQLARKYGRPGRDLIRRAVLNGDLPATRMAETRTSPYIINEADFRAWVARHRVVPAGQQAVA